MTVEKINMENVSKKMDVVKLIDLDLDLNTPPGVLSRVEQ